MIGLGGAGMSAQMLYRTTQTNFDRRFEAFAKQPMQARAVEHFRTEAPKKLTPKEVLDDFRLQRFLLQAFGLEEMGNSRALVEKILTQDLDDEKSLVWRMNDQRFVRMATALRFDQGVGKLQFPKVVDQLVDRYLTQGYEAQIGEQNPQVRQAMYFKRRAPDISNAFQLLGDKALRDVATTIAGLPPQAAQLDLDKQADLIKEKIDLSKLKDPVYVEELMQKYLARVDAQSGPSGAAAGVLQLFQPARSGGLSLNLLV
ncbi:MAG: DUF1217 domain-containing protein [Azospirillaceae bacterium]